MNLTLSFPIGIVGEIEIRTLYKELYKSVTSVVEEDDVVGVQVYPAQWPRKVLIGVKNESVKETLLIAGIEILDKHVELRDEQEQFTKVIIKDAPMSWSDEKMGELLTPYGKVVKVEKEMMYIDGKVTRWTTGTRFVYMCPLERTIPRRLVNFDEDGERQVAMSVWYKHPQTVEMKCMNCGGSHNMQQCNFTKKVCYICHGDHERARCPKDDGSRFNDDVFCFLTEKSPLSNFNASFPVTIREQAYLCNEQFIQSQKAKLFSDHQAFTDIMRSEDAREMQKRGKRIRGYNDEQWKAKVPEIIQECVSAKVYQNVEVRDYLLKTGTKQIGEGSPNQLFGVGLHISDPKILNPQEWKGGNLMGKVLMEVRSELLLLNQFGQDDFFDCLPPLDNNSALSELSQQEASAIDYTKDTIVVLGDSNVQGMVANFSNLEFDVEMVCSANPTLQNIDDMLNACKATPHKVKAVLLHLGTDNWSDEVQNDRINAGDLVYKEYIECLNTTTNKFPFAQLLVSSVPPRLPSDEEDIHTMKINDAVKELNRLLKELSVNESNVTYIDNDGILFENNEINSNLYNVTDKVGVHFSEIGCEQISLGFLKAMKSCLDVGE